MQSVRPVGGEKVSARRSRATLAPAVARGVVAPTGPTAAAVMFTAARGGEATAAAEGT